MLCRNLDFSSTFLLTFLLIGHSPIPSIGRVSSRAPTDEIVN